ncbi:MAG: LacI family DNA-binding transcriptional regulator [Brevinema sp.]
MANIRDVASLAKTSATTVSRVISGKGYVSARTKDRVEHAIKELNFVPNELAKNLFQKKTFLIGVLVPDVSHPFFASMVKHIEIACHQIGYKVILCNTSQQTNQEKEYTDMLQKHKVDGIILGSHTLNTEEYVALNIPMVALDRIIDQQIPIISSNHKQGGELVADLIIQQNYHHVLQITGSQTVPTPADDRHRVLEQILGEHRIELSTEKMERNNFGFAYYEQRVSEILQKYDGVDVIFAVDFIIATCLKILKKMGKRVPQDIQLIGYDGGYLAEMLDLTTIEQPIEELAQHTVQTLQKLIDKKPLESYHIQSEVRLRRGSTTL